MSSVRDLLQAGGVYPNKPWATLDLEALFVGGRPVEGGGGPVATYQVPSVEHPPGTPGFKSSSAPASGSSWSAGRASSLCPGKQGAPTSSARASAETMFRPDVFE